MTTTDTGLLAQILAEVRAVGVKVSALEVANAAVIADARHRASQVDDHEARLREIERVDLVTQEDLASASARRLRSTMLWVTGSIGLATLLESAFLAARK